MIKQQSGFTLIELIMVIVVLGALAVSAIPRYVDLQQEADQAAVEGVAGALSAGSAINYAACVAGDGAECIDSTEGMDDCDEVAVTIAGGATNVPATGYTINDLAMGAGVGSLTTCTVAHTASGLTADFSAIRPPVAVP